MNPKSRLLNLCNACYGQDTNTQIFRDGIGRLQQTVEGPLHEFPKPSQLLGKRMLASQNRMKYSH